MGSEDAGRSMISHGLFLFLLGLLTGFVIPALTSPRFGASEILSIAGVGYSATAWQEQLVKVGLGLGALSILLASILVLYGLRGGTASTSLDREL